MGNVSSVFSSSLEAVNSAENQIRVGGETIKLEFDPQAVGAVRQRNGKYPPTIAISENAVEMALLKHFGFNADNPADLSRTKELLQTADSHFAALKTTGNLVAAYNNRTGKYEILDVVEKSLYSRLQGKATEIKTQIENEKQTDVPTSNNPNELIASRNGITNNKRTELESKLNNQASISAPNDNESEKTVKSITNALETITGTGDPFAATEIGKQFNRLGISTLRLTGKAMDWSNYFSEKLNDALRYVAPDSIDALLNQSDRINRENAQALQNANSAVTNEDTFIDTRAKHLGQKIPITENLANKVMYFPEGIPNAIDSAIRGDFKEDDGTYSDKVGKIIGGLNPAGDIRDIFANGKNIFEGKPGAWIGLGAAIVGVVPILGDGGKIVLKAEKEVIAETVEKMVKQGVEQETAEKLAKDEVAKMVKEAVEKRYDDITANGHVVQRHGETITERQLDDRAMYGKDPITGTTDDAFRKDTGGNPLPHRSGKDATKFTSKESVVKAEAYVKNSQKYKDALDEAALDGSDQFAVDGIKLEDIFGADYKKEVFGKTRTGTKSNPIGAVETDFTDGTVKVVFKKDAGGQWNLETMYPEPKN